MKRNSIVFIGLVTAFLAGYFLNSVLNTSEKKEIFNIDKDMDNKGMKLGAFSISINVKDLKTSKAFYENLGFKISGGGMEMNYLIMKNENALIGLFQGMFDGNILTFNPGWNEKAENIKEFDDIRSIQKAIKTKGIELMTEADTSGVGPASIMFTDPDGNLILIDQHR